MPSDPSRPERAGGRGSAAPRRRRQPGVQPRQHDGPQRGHHAPAAEDRLPDHRGAPRHARPRAASGARSTLRPTRPGGARSATQRARSCRATCGAACIERILADGSVLIAARRGAGPPPARACSRAATSRASRSACSTPTSTPRTRSGCASWPGRCSATSPISISSETSPLAKEYARASTTVVDVLMKLIFTRLRGRSSTASCAGSASTGELNFADCAATLLPWDEALEQPFRIVFAGPAAGTVSSTRLGEALGDGKLLCCDVGGTSTDVSLVARRPAVRRQHLRARARPDHQRAVDRDARASAPEAAASSRSRRRATCSSGLAAPAPTRDRPATGRGGEAPTLTDACLLMGILDPDGFAGGELRLDSDLARRAFESLDTPLRLDQRVAFAFRIAVANIAEEVTERRHPPRRRPARLQPRRLRRRRADAASRGARAPAREAARRPAAPGALLRARPAEHRPRLLRQPQRVRRALSGDGTADLDGLRGDGAAAARQSRHRRRTASPSGAASTGASWGRAGRRRSSRCPRGRSRRRRFPS